MAFKWAPDDFFDNDGLDNIEDTCDCITVCSDNLSTPPTYTECYTTHMLVKDESNITSADFTVADGDTSGRKITVAEQANVTITNSGTAAQICLLRTGGTEVLYVTTCDTQALTATNQVTIPAFDIEVRDPS